MNSNSGINSIGRDRANREREREGEQKLSRKSRICRVIFFLFLSRLLSFRERRRTSKKKTLSVREFLKNVYGFMFLSILLYKYIKESRFGSD